MYFRCTDYLVSLYGVPEGPARESVKHECHERCADRLQKLFFKNGGIYIKLGQHIGQLVRFPFTSYAFSFYISFSPFYFSQEPPLFSFISCAIFPSFLKASKLVVGPSEDRD